MRTLILIIACMISATCMGQVVKILKPVSVNDTTITKSFIKYNAEYNIYDKVAVVSLTTYMSRSGLRMNKNNIEVPEIPGIIVIDLSADQNKTLSQLDNVVRQGIRANLKDKNPGWVNDDIVFE